MSNTSSVIIEMDMIVYNNDFHKHEHILLLCMLMVTFLTVRTLIPFRGLVNSRLATFGVL